MPAPAQVSWRSASSWASGPGSDLVPAGMVGPAMGLYRTISDLGLVLGPVLLGTIVDAWGYDPAFAVNAALMLLSTLLFAAAAGETTGKNAG
jgi:sugar phosphate permease